MSTRRILNCALALALALPALLAATGEEGADDKKWAKADEIESSAAALKSFFEGAEVRYPGSTGNLALEKKIAEIFSGSGFQHGEIRFETAAFAPGQASIQAEGLPLMRMYAMHPTVARPGNFIERTFQAPLVYLGRGTVEDLAAAKGIELKGALALMDFDCGEDWSRLLRFGLKGVIFSGKERYEYSDAVAKVYISEAAFPRYFVSAEDGAKLKAALITSEAGKSARTALPARIESEPSRVRNVNLRNLWVLIPGSDPAQSKDVVVVTAPMDANCVVPELAEGAQNGGNLFLLIKLLQSFTKEAPPRSVLLVALNAHSASCQGERMLAWHLLTPQRDVEDLRNLLTQDIRLQEMYQKYYSELLALLDDAAKPMFAEDYLINMRAMSDSSTGKQITVKDKLVNRARSDVNKAKTERLDRYRELKKQGQTEEQARAAMGLMEKNSDKYVNVLKLFNKWGQSKVLSDLSEEERRLLRGYVADVLNENATAAELNHRDLERDQQNNAIRDVLQGRTVKLVLLLELNFQSRKMGFWSASFFNNPEWRRAFGAQAIVATSAIKGVKDGRDDLFVDTMTFGGGLPEGHYFSGGEAVTYIHTANKTPALSLQNVFTHFGNVFTPGDTIQALNKETVAELANYVPAAMRAIIGSDMSTLKPADARWLNWSIQLRTCKFDEFSASVVPEVLVTNALVTLQPRNPVPITGDVVMSQVALTDQRALTFFYGIKEWQSIASTAMQFDPDFTRVVHTIDGGEKETALSSNVVRSPSQTLVMFPCVEYSILAREDPSLIGAGLVRVQNILPLDAKRETRPRQLGLAGVTSTFSDKKHTATLYGPASVFTDGKQKLKFLTDTKMPVLNVSPEFPEGEGFSSPSELSSDFFADAAGDVRALSAWRLDRLRGISQELALDFLDVSDKAMQKAKAAKQEHDHVAYLQALYTSLGAGRQAHAQVNGITNDMLQAVIFYMALILPFCFFMQKLIFNFVKIEAQIGGFFFLFLICYIAFRNIHPAFEVAKSPEGILIAFIMGALGIFVIQILHGRFEGEMQLLFRNFAGDVSEVGFSTVGQKAMLIGVNNMRRRRVRTLLTTTTIVLVTFTMLSFTSISSKMSPRVVPVSRNAPPYTGFMYHLPARRMDEASMKILREVFHGRADVIVRRWQLPASWEKTVIPMRLNASTGKSAKLDAVLGMSKAEDGFLAPMPLVAGRFFSSDDADEAVLPASIAETVGLNARNFDGAKVTFMGRELSVVGIIDDQKLRMLSDLDGLLLLPQKESLASSGGSTAGDVVAGGSTGMQVQGADQTGFYVEPSSIILLPLERSAKFGATAYSVSVRFKDEAVALWPEVINLLRVTNAKFYIGSRAPFLAGMDDEKAKPGEGEKKAPHPEMKPGVYYVGSNFSTSFGNLSSLIIPLLISGTIILNTMLGSVYERKKEIAIYNAVGLNPNHIGMFFLSEAFVYSVVGSVGGYMIGQVLSIGLIHLGVEGIDLNFSSLKVVYVILFTIAMVLLSTLYPAIVATRAAVPSGKRKWELPDHDGQTMKIVFPFIYQPDVVRGITGYLEEYFARFTEASVGDLIAVLEQRTHVIDADGREVITLQYNVALAPFDLGVTQRVTFTCAWDQRVQAHRLTLTSSRLSGQDTNWVTTNKPFLERLRTYLMHWRNLSPEQQAVYAQTGEKIEKIETVPPSDDVGGATVVLPG